MKKLIVAMIAATLGLSSAAFAQNVPKTGGKKTFKQVMDSPLGNTGLTVGAGTGIAAGVIIAGVIISEDDNSSTTTSTK
jgi:hypothetical protein